MPTRFRHLQPVVLRRKLPALTIALLLTPVLQAADALTRYDPAPGSKVRIEGTSSVHDWQVESSLIGGRLEVGSGFPTEPGQAIQPGKIDAKADVFIPVRSLKSVEKDGRPYSESMDDIMYGKLLQPTHPRIQYHLTELVLKEAPKDTNAPYLFEAAGQLVVAGVTNHISMPLNVTPLGGKKLKITGTTTVKMTDFGIKPPAPALALGLIKTGDEVKLIFDWRLQHKTAGGPP
jgi:hypothetical protein